MKNGITRHYIQWFWIWSLYFASTLVGISASDIIFHTTEVTKKPDTQWQTEVTRLLSDVDGLDHSLKISVDQYGGDRRSRLQATGYFRVEKQQNGAWTLVTPLGHPYYSVGMVSVGLQMNSPTVKQIFKMKFGDAKTWQEETSRQLHQWGFNSLGAWSRQLYEKPSHGQAIPYTHLLRFMGTFVKSRYKRYPSDGEAKHAGNTLYLFDPGFEEFCDAYAKKSVQEYRKDPYLIGYYSDNELAFYPDSLDKFLELAKDSHGGKAVHRWIAKRKRSKGSEITNEDRSEFLRFLTERYYSVVSKALKKYDPHHMYLGSRLHAATLATLPQNEWKTRPIWEVCGKWVDLVAINLYDIWNPRPRIMHKWEEWSGRPFFITEFYAKGIDSGMSNVTGAGWLVRTQEDRGAFYQTFALGMLETPNCVGWQWFKYVDNAIDGKADPSNRDSNKGLVNVRYEPYLPLLNAMTPINHHIYQLRDLALPYGFKMQGKWEYKIKPGESLKIAKKDFYSDFPQVIKDKKLDVRVLGNEPQSQGKLELVDQKFHYQAPKNFEGSSQYRVQIVTKLHDTPISDGILTIVVEP